MGMVDGSCHLSQTLLSGDQAQGGAWVEVVEGEAQEAAAAQLIHQQGLTLLIHICGTRWTGRITEPRGCQQGSGTETMEKTPSIHV